MLSPQLNGQIWVPTGFLHLPMRQSVTLPSLTSIIIVISITFISLITISITIITTIIIVTTKSTITNVTDIISPISSTFKANNCNIKILTTVTLIQLYY